MFFSSSPTLINITFSYQYYEFSTFNFILTISSCIEYYSGIHNSDLNKSEEIYPRPFLWTNTSQHIITASIMDIYPTQETILKIKRLRRKYLDFGSCIQTIPLRLSLKSYFCSCRYYQDWFGIPYSDVIDSTVLFMIYCICSTWRILIDDIIVSSSILSNSFSSFQFDIFQICYNNRLNNQNHLHVLLQLFHHFHYNHLFRYMFDLFENALMSNDYKLWCARTIY